MGEGGITLGLHGALNFVTDKISPFATKISQSHIYNCTAGIFSITKIRLMANHHS